MEGHTILFLKLDEKDSSKTWADHDTLDAALDGLKVIFEKKLRVDRPKAREIVYDLSELCQFIDDLPDVALLTFQEFDDGCGYVPHDKTWLKENISDHLKRKFRKNK